MFRLILLVLFNHAWLDYLVRVFFFLRYHCDLCCLASYCSIKHLWLECPFLSFHSCLPLQNWKLIHFIAWAGTPCFRGHGRRNGERRRKSVRGCIVRQDLSVLNLVIVRKKGENDLLGLIDTEKPRIRGPKRASKIRKLFNLSKKDDIWKNVNAYRRTFTTKYVLRRAVWCWHRRRWY